MMADYIGVIVGLVLSTLWLIWFISSSRHFGAWSPYATRLFPFSNTFISGLLIVGVMVIPIWMLRSLGISSHENVMRSSLVSLALLVTCYATSLVVACYGGALDLRFKR